MNFICQKSQTQEGSVIESTCEVQKKSLEKFGATKHGVKKFVSSEIKSAVTSMYDNVIPDKWLKKFP